jgi:hypothetical protein
MSCISWMCPFGGQPAQDELDERREFHDCIKCPALPPVVRHGVFTIHVIKGWNGWLASKVARTTTRPKEIDPTSMQKELRGSNRDRYVLELRELTLIMNNPVLCLGYASREPLRHVSSGGAIYRA